MEKEPALKAGLTMSVMTGNRYVRQSEKRDAGTGSSSRDLKDIASKVFDTSISQTG